MAERILGLDYGERRVGVAVSDGLGVTAQPLTVIATAQVADMLPEIIEEYQVGEIVVGLPQTLQGTEGPMARQARAFAAEVEDLTGLPIRLVDERFTTAVVERVLLQSGARRQRRRQVRDKMAAAVLLQGYLDAAS